MFYLSRLGFHQRTFPGLTLAPETPLFETAYSISFAELR